MTETCGVCKKETDIICTYRNKNGVLIRCCTSCEDAMSKIKSLDHGMIDLIKEHANALSNDSMKNQIHHLQLLKSLVEVSFEMIGGEEVRSKNHG